MPKEPDSIRAFIAINFPPGVKDVVPTVGNQLKGIKGRISWVKSESVHLTLKFLGEISSQQVEQVKNALEIGTRNIYPFKLSFTDLGVFPSKNRPRVIWWGLKSDSPQLTQLYNNIENHLADYGFPREHRHYTPHLTLGRIRELTQPQQVMNTIKKVKLPVIEAVTIKSVELMCSTLQSGGAIYTSLASFKFKTSD